MNRCSPLALSLLALLPVASRAPAGEPAEQAAPPDLTREIDFELTGEYFLGPTGAKGWMYVNERFMTDEARQILVTSVEEGSPADGVLEPGDVILGVGDAHFQADPRKCLGRAIDQAEREQDRGVLRLLRWRPLPDAPTRKGREQVVELRLPVLGTYSDTAPYDCPKTARLLERALRVLEESDDWELFGVKALAFLATGEEKYTRLVHDYLHEVNWARPDFQMSVESGGLVCWGAGYRNLVLTEYYLATGDKYVLPAIREHAVKTAMGQSNGGVWGHGFAWTSQNDGRLHGRLGGYGAVNQAGLPCLLALVLSKKCGIEHPEIDDAIERARRFFRQFVGKGSIGYGYHRPSLEIHCNGRNGMSGNGKNGIAAVVFGLLGDRPSQQFFSMLTISCHNTCEYGHSGNSYSYFWDPLGANYGGPAAAAAFHKELRWYYALTRRPDGSFVNQPLGGHYGRDTLDATVSHVLMMTSPRRAIYLTGKDEDPKLWLNDKQVEEAVEAGHWRFADTEGISADELIARLDNWSPIAREWIAIALGKKQGDFVPRLLELLQSDKPEARAGACAALGYQGERAARAVPAVARALHDEEPIVRIAAGYALARMQEPARRAVPDMLQAVLATGEPGPMRPTQQALAYSLGYAPGKYAPLYFSGVLPNLSGDGDPFEGVDRQLVREAVATLLKDPSGRVRGCGAYALKFFTREDLAVLAQPIYDAILTPAPNYAMFDDDPRKHGLDLFVRLGIAEGVPLCLETMEPDRWGHHVRVTHRLQTLRRYGAAARPLLPQLELLRWEVKSAEYRRLLEEAIQAVETDHTAPALVSLHTLVDERLAGDLAQAGERAQARDDAQRVRLCRDLMREHADDGFYQAAGLRQLVALLGPDAFDDIAAALGHSRAELRRSAVKLGAELPGEKITRRWIDELSRARAAKAADILEILALRGSSQSRDAKGSKPSALLAARKQLSCDEPVVRAAAMRAVAVLGGADELPRLIESLADMVADMPSGSADAHASVGSKTPGTPTDYEAALVAAQEAIERACRSHANDDQAAARLADTRADLPAEVQCVLIRVLGRLDSDRALELLRAAADNEDRQVSQAALDALAVSPPGRATDVLLSLLSDAPTRQLKGTVATACLRRVVIGRVARERKFAILEGLLSQDVAGRNKSTALAELAWVPCIEAMRLAQSFLDKRDQAEAAAAAVVAIAGKLDTRRAEQREEVERALEQVLQASRKEETLQQAETLLDELGNATEPTGGQDAGQSAAAKNAEPSAGEQGAAPPARQQGAALSVAQQGAAPSANLLPNPSFEQADAQGVRAWTPRAWQGEQAGHWEVASPGRTGRRCVSIGSEQGSDAAWTTTVAVAPNSLYRLAGWIKTENVQGAAGALLNIQNMQQVRTSRLRGTLDWTRVSTVFRTAEQTELEINCLFGGWGTSTGHAWFDDVVLEPIAGLADQTEAILTIRPHGPRTAYSPMLFGGFIEHFHRQIYGGLFEPGSPLSDEHGFRKDVIQALRELKLSVVRWPGGCFASGYHWRDGVGTPRRPVADPVWGVVDPNTFGTDEFVEWCRLVGCQPYICTNAGNGTPEEMRDWVEYCNATQGRWAELRASGAHTEPLGVRYWSIGNENWGSHEIGARRPDQWGPLVRRSAELMLTVDPKLKLLAAATPNPNWTLPLLATAGDRLDYIAIHQYWLPCWRRNLTPDYLSCIMLSEGPEQTIRSVIDLLEEAGCRGRIKIAFDEWNLRGWHHPGFPRKQPSDPHDPAVRELIAKREINADASQYTMADALFSASFLNACLRHADDVGMANIAPIVNTRGPLYVYPKGIVRRTTFHTLAMYANELEPLVVPLELETGMLVQGRRFLPVLDGVATVDPSGTRWAVALVNRHPTEQIGCAIRFADTLFEGPGEATILAGDSPDAYNDAKHPRRVVPERKQLSIQRGLVLLPPHSLVILRARR